jgi:adenylate cyclase class IV
MPRNVEIKARVENLDEVKQLAKKLSGEDGTLIEQEDTFFNSPQGYLKLREIKVR